MKSGFVSFTGRPNVGKSTLMNAVMGQKVAITSNKNHTTRNNIQAIYNDQESQIIFVDTPGIHKPREKVGKYLNQKAYYSMEDVDIVCFVVDASKPLGKGDRYVIERLNKLDKTLFLIINKIDLVKKEDLLKKISEYKDLADFSEIIPVSALKEDNLIRFMNVIKHYLPDGIKYYDDPDTNIQSEAFLISEIVREKVMRLTKDEVPYAVTTMIEKFNNKKDVVEIGVQIIVDRENLKGIILGKRGAMIKSIGMKARDDIEKIYNKKVYLELFVKVIKNWRDKERYLEEFGIKNIE